MTSSLPFASARGAHEWAERWQSLALRALRWAPITVAGAAPASHRLPTHSFEGGIAQAGNGIYVVDAQRFSRAPWAKTRRGRDDTCTFLTGGPAGQTITEVLPDLARALLLY